MTDNWIAIERDQWELAGVADRVELRLGPDIDTLRSLQADVSIDLAFVDADTLSIRRLTSAIPTSPGETTERGASRLGGRRAGVNRRPLRPPRS